MVTIDNEARAAVMQLLSGYWYSQALHTAVRLGLADLLVEGPATADELAARCSAHGPSLERLLRALSTIGVLAACDDGRYDRTPLSDCLSTEADGSLRAAALFGGSPLHWQAWQGLYDAVCSGRSAFELVHGQPLFERLAASPDVAELFQQVMSGGTGWDASILDACQLEDCQLLVDVGGGHGQLARAAVSRYPELQAVVYDRPDVAAACQSGDDRLRFEGGDFFQSVPVGGDRYLLRFILHDWPDEQATAILQSCRHAMAPGARVLIVDHLLAESGPSPAALLDVSMMVLTGGKERSQSQVERLLEAAGMALERVTPTTSGLFILTARARA